MVRLGGKWSWCRRRRCARREARKGGGEGRGPRQEERFHLGRGGRVGVLSGVVVGLVLRDATHTIECVMVQRVIAKLAE